MYEIEDFDKLGCPRVVRMSFELPYLDWCRFERSELYQNLTAYLEELEKQERKGVRETDKKNEYEEYINLLQWHNGVAKNRYRFWRTIATISIIINGFIFGLALGVSIFQ